MLTRIAAPAQLPVSLLEAKMAMNVANDRNDALLQAYLEAAVEYLDGSAGLLGRAMITQTWEWKTPCFELPMRLPLGPVQSITSVKYLDGAGAEQTWDPANYYLMQDAKGDYARPIPTSAWPSTYDRDDAVRITFIAGYGDTAASVPRPIRTAIMMIASHLNEHRELQVDVRTFPTGFAAWDLIEPYRRVF